MIRLNIVSVKFYLEKWTCLPSENKLQPCFQYHLRTFSYTLPHRWFSKFEFERAIVYNAGTISTRGLCAAVSLAFTKQPQTYYN